MFEKPKRFFVRQLLAILMTFILLVVIVALTGGGNTGIIFAGILSAINAFLLFFLLVIASSNLIRSLRDKENVQRGMHTVNFILSLLAAGGYLLFYLTVVVLALIPLLPFL